MSDNKFERVDEKDPNRCQGLIITGPNAGQCCYKAVEGSKFCPRHCGQGASAAKKNELKNYQLQHYRQRVGDLSNSPEIKSLREEIGIVRMTLETILNQCDNANKLIMYTGQISNLVGQITKLVQVCQSIEERNNNLLDRKVVIVMADSLVTLVAQYVKDPDQLNEIGARFVECIDAASVRPEAGVGAVA